MNSIRSSPLFTWKGSYQQATFREKTSFFIKVTFFIIMAIFFIVIPCIQPSQINRTYKVMKPFLSYEFASSNDCIKDMITSTKTYRSFYYFAFSNLASSLLAILLIGIVIPCILQSKYNQNLNYQMRVRRAKIFYLILIAIRFVWQIVMIIFSKVTYNKFKSATETCGINYSNYYYIEPHDTDKSVIAGSVVYIIVCGILAVIALCFGLFGENIKRTPKQQEQQQPPQVNQNARNNNNNYNNGYTMNNQNQGPNINFQGNNAYNQHPQDNAYQQYNMAPKIVTNDQPMFRI